MCFNHHSGLSSGCVSLFHSWWLSKYSITLIHEITQWDPYFCCIILLKRFMHFVVKFLPESRITVLSCVFTFQKVSYYQPSSSKEDCKTHFPLHPVVCDIFQGFFGELSPGLIISYQLLNCQFASFHYLVMFWVLIVFYLGILVEIYSFVLSHFLFYSFMLSCLKIKFLYSQGLLF